jgi:uroporphyrinogen decarboxylase
MNRRLLDVLEGRPADRIPFLPAVYEHKAWLIGATPSAVCRDARLLEQAVVAEVEQIRPDAVTVGIDPYNIEAEAAGSPVQYDEGGTGVPSVIAGREVLHDGAPLSSLRIPDPSRDGRMPLMLETAAAVQTVLGEELPVRAPLSGPFSMAAGIMGTERLFMAALESPVDVRELLTFCLRTIARYGAALLRCGCGVVIFDSQASPGVVSPRIYRELLLEPTRALIAELRASGAAHVPLIIGGNTLPILPALVDTGANNLLCDFRTPVAAFGVRCAEAGRAFRCNIDPTGFLDMTPEAAAALAREKLAAAGSFPGCILGTGVVPYGTPTEVLAAIRETVARSGPQE